MKMAITKITQGQRKAVSMKNTFPTDPKTNQNHPSPTKAQISLQAQS